MKYGLKCVPCLHHAALLTCPLLGLSLQFVGLVGAWSFRFSWKAAK